MRILTSADLHIHDYPKYNLTGPGFRMDQFIQLAHRFVQIYKQFNCEKIVIAGDSIQTAVIRPEIQHTLVKFYQILSDGVAENGGDVDVTIGNHDKDSRALDTKREESLVSLLDLIPRVNIKHKVVEDIDGLSVGYSDFIPEHELEWIEGKVDILFNHYTDMGPTWGGQSIDKDKFGVMFFGDIHVPYRRGNIVSIGNPIPHRLKDSCEGKAIIIDTQGEDFDSVVSQEIGSGVHELDRQHEIEVLNGRKITWVWTDVITPETPFIRLYRPDKPPRKWAGELPYDVCVPYNRVQQKAQSEVGEISGDVTKLDVDSILEANLTDVTKEVHTKVLEIAKDSDISEEAVSMDFRLVSTFIKNFRSIDELRINWDGGVRRFTGHIGSGKSTIARALMFNFYGDRAIRDQFRDTADPKKEHLEVDVVIEYNGIFHRIERGWDGSGYLYYWKSADEDKILLDSYLDKKDPNWFPREQANKQADIDAMIRRDLPFLDLDKLFYIPQMSSGLFSDMKKNARIEMIAKLLGWNKVVDYSDIASGLLKVKKEEIDVTLSEISKLDGLIEATQERNLVLDETDYQSQIDALLKERESVEKSITDHNSYLNVLKTAEMKESNAESKLNTTRPVLDGTIDTIDAAKEALEGIDNKIKALEEAKQEEIDRVAKEQNEIVRQRGEIAKAKQEITAEIGNVNLHNSNLDNALANAKSDLDRKKTQQESLTLAFNKAKEELEAEVTEKCVLCGQDVHDEQKIAEAKQKRQANFDQAEKALKDINAEVVQAAMEFGNATKAASEKKSAEELNEKIAALDANSVVLDEQMKSISPVNPELVVEIAQLNNSKTPITTFITQMELYESTIEDGKKLEEEAAQIRSAAEAMPHLDDVDAARKKSEDLLSEVSSIYPKQTKAKEDNEAIKLMESRILEREGKEASIESIKVEMEHIEEYINLTSFTGPIVQAILTKTSEMLSTDTMVVKTIEEKRNGNHKPDLTLSVLIGEKWKDYSQLSGGQLFYADMKFILSLLEVIGKCGWMCFDEAFKFLDPDMIDEIGLAIKDSENLRDVMVITHAESYIYAEKVVEAHLDDMGISHYTFH
ncbi:coil containing protein [Vibrio phage Va2]|nr:coil containing protein [Vibrio phage Va2]